MINKQILASAFSIVTVLSLTAGATLAYFSDSATSSGNTFSSGNADLQIAPDASGNPGTFSDTLNNAFNVSNITPGYDAVHMFWLKNNSSSSISLDMVTDISTYTAPNPEDLALASNLLVSWRCDLSNNNSLGDETYTSEFSVKEWFDGGSASLGNISNGDAMFCEMRTRVLSSVENTIANGDVDFDVKFDGTQTP